MSVRFEFYENPSSPGDDSKKKKKKFHARVVGSSTVDTDYVIREIHERTSLTPGDVQSALTSLANMVSYHLRQGDRVHLKGLGYFQVILTCDDPKGRRKLSARDVRFKSVKFRADSFFKSKVGDLRVERAKYRRHSEKLSEIEIDRRLTLYFEENATLTRYGFQKIFRMAQATALRHIRKLREAGKLKNINTLTHPVYIPVPGYYRLSRDKEGVKGL